MTSKGKSEWNICLLLCCLAAALASYQFGYNIGALNTPMPLVKQFVKADLFLFEEFYSKSEFVKVAEGWLAGNATAIKEAEERKARKQIEYIACFWSSNMKACQEAILEEARLKLAELNERFNASYANIDELLDDKKELLKNKTAQLQEGKKLLAEAATKIDLLTNLLWIAVNALFVLGGAVGAACSKSALRFFGRRDAVVFVNEVSGLGSLLAFGALYFHTPICFMIARLIQGISGGMSCNLVSIYLSEIAPNSLRRTVVSIPQLLIPLGILSSQLLGFRQLLGTACGLRFLVALPLVPALVAGLSLHVYFPESPKALLVTGRVDSARAALRLLRDSSADVEREIAEFNSELDETKTPSNSERTSSKRLLVLVVSALYQVCKQFVGLLVVFFYSSSLIGLLIDADSVQYVVVCTGLANLVSAAIVTTLFADNVRRKAMFVFPQIVLIVVNFVLLCSFLRWPPKGQMNSIYNYMSISCILMFVMFFSIGLGPTPFIHSVEGLKSSERGTALTVCTIANWISALVITIAFPIVSLFLEERTYLVLVFFAVILLLVVIFKKPETNESICNEINGKLRDDKIKPIDHELDVMNF